MERTCRQDGRVLVLRQWTVSAIVARFLMLNRDAGRAGLCSCSCVSHIGQSTPEPGGSMRTLLHVHAAGSYAKPCDCECDKPSNVRRSRELVAEYKS